MCKDAVDTGGIIHRKIESSNGAITPAYYCHLGDVQMIKDRNRITSEVIVVESSKVCVRRSALASCATRQLAVGYMVLDTHFIGVLLQNDSSCLREIVRLVEHQIAITGSSMQKQDWRVIGLLIAEARIP